MKRRSFFGSALAAAAGLFSASPATAEPIDHTKPERDARGKAICRIYRLAADGTWREIRPGDVRAGDKIICIGQDGDRLWKADACEVVETFPPKGGDAGGVMIKDGTDTDLLKFS